MRFTAASNTSLGGRFSARLSPRPRSRDRPLRDAEEELRAAGLEELADELRDRHPSSRALGDIWTYEIVGSFRNGFLADVVEFEATVREELADGIDHVTERERQAEWRDRTETDGWRCDSASDSREFRADADEG